MWVQISRNEANSKVKEALERLKAVRAEVKSRVDLVKPMWETQRKLQEAGKLANSKRRDLPCATEEELDYKVRGFTRTLVCQIVHQRSGPDELTHCNGGDCAQILRIGIAIEELLCVHWPKSRGATAGQVLIAARICAADSAIGVHAAA